MMKETGSKSRIFFSSLLFNFMLDVLVKTREKRHQIGKKVKLSLLSDKIILYAENLKEFTKTIKI